MAISVDDAAADGAAAVEYQCMKVICFCYWVVL